MLTAIEEREAFDPRDDGALRARFRVVIAGAGPAGVEAALALASDRRRPVSTRRSSRPRALRPPPAGRAVAVRRGRRPPPSARRRSPARTCVADGSSSVDSASREVRLGDGDDLAYDALLVAVGGDPAVAVPTRARVRHPGQRRADARTDPGPRGRLHQAHRVRRPSGGVVAAADLRTGADDGGARLRHVRRASS